MAIPASPPSTDPAQILRYRDRQYAAELIATALLHFDLFTWMYDHDSVATEELAEHFGFAERPLDVLLTLCRANRFIETKDGRHSVAQLGCEHLVRSSPWFLGPYYEPIRDTPIVTAYRKVLATGKPANWQAQDDGDDWHQSMLSQDFAQGFTALMNCRGLAFGQVLAEKAGPLIGDRKRLLDVGGGSGIYASTMVAALPQLRGTVLEQAPVDAIARKEIESHGLSDRVEVVKGDMFQDAWPETDVVLLSNVLHDWDFPEVRALLQKTADTVPPDGLVVIHEAFLHDDKTGPLPVAEYSALLMNITQGKCYTPQEYGDILGELGFKVGPYVDTIADRGFMAAVKR